jgi:hypothetical protein
MDMNSRRAGRTSVQWSSENDGSEIESEDSFDEHHGSGVRSWSKKKKVEVVVKRETERENKSW